MPQLTSSFSWFIIDLPKEIIKIKALFQNAALSKPGLEMKMLKKDTYRGTEFSLRLSSSMSRTVKKKKNRRNEKCIQYLCY